MISNSAQRINLAWTDTAREASAQARRKSGDVAENATTPEEHASSAIYHGDQAVRAMNAGDNASQDKHNIARIAHEYATNKVYKPKVNAAARGRLSGVARAKSKEAHLGE